MVMVKILIYGFALFYIVITGACQKNVEEGEEKQIKDEVMSIHDEIMPEMQIVFNLKKQLIHKRDSLQQVDPDEMLSPATNEIDLSIQKLNEANQSMMQWMRNYNPDPDIEQEEKRIAYYKKERDNIREVKSQFEIAIHNAQQILAKING
jgi:hypothetical protein